MRIATFAAAWVLFSLGSLGTAGAQDTGYELALSGPSFGYAGRTAAFRGTAYRVRGLASLVPFEGPVRARMIWADAPQVPPREPTAWTLVQADARGRFAFELAIPEDAATGLPQVEVEVGLDGRREAFGLRVEPAYEIALRTDRVLYEPGEPLHVWGLVRDRLTRRPVEGREVEIHLYFPTGSTRRTLTSAASGVVHAELSAGRAHGLGSVLATMPGGVRIEQSFTVGARSVERVLVSVEVDPEEVAPHAPATVRVRVTTTSGTPIAGASVSAVVDTESTYSGETDARGEAHLDVRAPSYLAHETGAIPIAIEVSHAAHGSARASASMTLAVPLALTVEAIPEHGVLVPELASALYLRLRDGTGRPPASGTELVVTGPAIEGGRQTAVTDANGLAEVRARLPLGADAMMEGVSTPIVVDVRGPVERTTRLAVPVAREVEVSARLDAVVLEPRGRVAFRIDRRPSAARREVVAELLDDSGQPLALLYVTPGARTASFDLPDRVGLFWIHVRARHEDEYLEGMGLWVPFIVRPPAPDVPRVESAAPRYAIGERATVRVVTEAGGPRRYAALLVRDLAAQAGEQPFSDAFLRGEFDRAMLVPSGDGERLVRAALAAHGTAEGAPHRALPLVDELGLPTEATYEDASQPNVYRDPWPLARELARRGAADAMRRVEARLSAALDAGALDEVTVVAAGRRAFRADLLDEGADSPKTLGGALVTPAMLEASDPSFAYDRVARRVARARLVKLLAALSLYVDPGDEAAPLARRLAEESSDRWLARMVERGRIARSDLDDPWGGRFAVRAVARPAIALSERATGLELVSAGPDARFGTRDDVRDPFERAVPPRTPYALASGEDDLMRSLAVLSALEATLVAIAEAYRRENVEVREEEIGDAVSAEVSEGVIRGLVGSGSGSGYGRGAGGLRGRSASVPQIRSGAASVRGLASVIRERFRPTLAFLPSVTLDPSGTTSIELPGAEATTTFLVEAIVWREDGWIWPASTTYVTDRPVVVDAPVPPVAHRGDRIDLPLRVSERSGTERALSVRLVGAESIGIPDSAPADIALEPNGSAVVPLRIEPGRAGRGRLTVALTTRDGTALDATRRPMRVVENARRVEIERDALVDSDARIAFDVPRGADPRRGTVVVRASSELFDAPAVGSLASAWANTEEPLSQAAWLALRARANASDVALALGASWRDPDVADDAIGDACVALTELLELDRSAREGLLATSEALVALGPAGREPGRREIDCVPALVGRLRETIAARAFERSDAPEIWVTAAAALARSAESIDRDRVAELLRRVARHSVRVGEDRWIATEESPVRSTLYYAMAELALGRRDAAFELLLTVARWAARGHVLSDFERALGRVVARDLGDPPPARATVWIDGVRRTVALTSGVASIDAPELARAGSHEVRARVQGTPLLLRTHVRFGVPWSVAPEEPGPFALRLEGESGGLDDVASLVLVVRNRVPRTLRDPIVEIELPTGAEIAPNAVLGAHRVEHGDGVLTLRLPPMRPGGEARVTLPMRWSVGGRLHGLGVAAYSADRRGAVTILAPRALEIRGDR